MFAIELAKFPPPSPAVAATSSMTLKGVFGFPTQIASPTAG